MNQNASVEITITFFKKIEAKITLTALKEKIPVNTHREIAACGFVKPLRISRWER